MSEKLCRLCLCNPIVSCSLLENRGVEMYEALTARKLPENDERSKMSCIKCWLNLKLAYQIQQGFLEAADKFQLELVKIVKKEGKPQKNVASNEITDDDSQETISLADTEIKETKEHQDHDDMIFLKGEINEDVDVYENSLDCSDSDNPDLDQDSTDLNHDQDIINLDDDSEPSKNEYNCVICGDLLSEHDIESHVKEHFNDVQYCDECDQRFDNLKCYKQHVIQEHVDQRKTWQCILCDASFQYKSFYNVHMEKAHIRRKERKTPNTIEEIIGDESTNGIYQCPECSKTYSDNRKFESHIKVHQRKKCHICNAMITISNLRKHILAHSAPPSVCHLCGATCKNHDSLRGHLYYTHSTNSFPCDYCGKIFKKKYSKMMHVKKEHTGEKNHVCETCGKAFFTNYCLSKHIKMTHLKLRPYICEHCNKAFSSKFALRTHTRQHTNDAPYKCDICGEGFRQNVSLRSHKKSKHDIIEEKNCECKVCGKMFVSEWAVQSHMRLH